MWQVITSNIVTREGTSNKYKQYICRIWISLWYYSIRGETNINEVCVCVVCFWERENDSSGLMAWSEQTWLAFESKPTYNAATKQLTQRQPTGYWPGTLFT